MSYFGENQFQIQICVISVDLMFFFKGLGLGLLSGRMK